MRGRRRGGPTSSRSGVSWRGLLPSVGRVSRSIARRGAPLKHRQEKSGREATGGRENARRSLSVSLALFSWTRDVFSLVFVLFFLGGRSLPRLVGARLALLWVRGLGRRYPNDALPTTETKKKGGDERRPAKAPPSNGKREAGTKEKKGRAGNAARNMKKKRKRSQTRGRKGGARKRSWTPHRVAVLLGARSR